MKLTRKKLIKVVEETIKEVSSSIGSRGARKTHQKNQTAQADAEASRQAASSAHKERETQKTAAKAARDTANQQHKSHLATEPKVDGRTKRGALGVSIGSSAKYYYTHRGNRYYSSTNNINQ